jgi:dedicated sortase system histidine kinase
MALATAGSSEHAGFWHSLRFKLLLASLTLLLIPWAGYYYLREMENALKQAQERLLLNRAEIVADMLESVGSDWNQQNPSLIPDGSQSLYVHPLHSPPDIDGYPDDWQALSTQAKHFSARSTPGDALSFDWLAGTHGDHLYLLIEVHDNQIVYPRSDHLLTHGDHLILALPGLNEVSRRYYLGTPAPGWINTLDTNNTPVHKLIQGEWQESSTGYRVELKLPLSLAHGRLSLAVMDIDQLGSKPIGTASTSGWLENQSLAYLTIPSHQANHYLTRLESQTHRYTLLNRYRQVIGRHGRIAVASTTQDTRLRQLFRLLFAESSTPLFKKRARFGRLDGPEIRQALAGRGAIYRYQSPESKLAILSSAFPIRNKDETQGVVVVEQSTHEILLLQQEAAEDLLMISLGMFLITGGTLLLLATTMAHRIARLSEKYQQAVTQDGRIIGEIVSTGKKDELGRLDNSLSSVLTRSKAYTHYLESMASRLAHEFRTPLTIIQSSLENLLVASNEHTTTAEHPRYVKRALDGTQRLNLILTRLREASRLEQALKDTQMEETEITALVDSLIQSYADSYNQVCFTTQLPDRPISCRAAPDLICQAMDKLISNALDFHTPQTPIVIEVRTGKASQITIMVINQGPRLDVTNRKHLFTSMQTKRPDSHDTLHLGLGLYLVRLIAEFHQGRVWAENIAGGVCFGIDLHT